MRVHVAATLLLTAVTGCGASSGSSSATARDGGGSGSPTPGSDLPPDDDSGVAGSDGSSAAGDDTTTSSSGGSSISPPDSGSADYDQVAPTPSSAWAVVTGNLAGMASECGNVGAVFSDPHEDRLITGIALHGLWASTDGAKTWTAIGTTGDSIKNRLTLIVFDPTNDKTFWESGIYGWETDTDGVFTTTNDGTSFTGYSGLVTASNGGNTDDSVSIDFNDPARKTLLAGTHETKQQIFLSTNAGTAWSNIGPALPSGLGFCTSTLVLDSTTFLVGCAASWSGEAGAILRSVDGGKTFTSVEAAGVVDQPLWASDGTIYWSAEAGGIYKSVDQGKTWSLVVSGSTAGTVPPIQLPDGRIVSAEQKNIVISADKGATWKTIGTPMPFAPTGLAYSPFRRAFYISYATCSGSNDVPSDSIQRAGWDYESQ